MKEEEEGKVKDWAANYPPLNTATQICHFTGTSCIRIRSRFSQRLSVKD